MPGWIVLKQTQSERRVTRPIDGLQGDDSIVEGSCGEVLDGLIMGGGFGRCAA